MTLTNTWAYLYGKPSATGDYKRVCADFKVVEDLGFELSGEGEHLFLLVEKENLNTLFVADQLAKWAKIPARNVSYAGLKDKFAVTTQWFSLHLPGIELDPNSFEFENIRILKHTRHNKKLRIGALKANQFELILRDLSDLTTVETRLTQIKKNGVPNYFGEQRFGIDNQNLKNALLWASDQIKVKDRKKRSFYLSAIRSYLFNECVSARLKNHCFDRVQCGDIVQLAGSKSWFVVKPEELESVQSRLMERDVHLTAPLMGDNGFLTQDDALQFEQSVLETANAQSWLPLLKQERVETARRSILTLPQNLTWQALDARTLKLDFVLPAGNYATSLVRELICKAENEDRSIF